MKLSLGRIKARLQKQSGDREYAREDISMYGLLPILIIEDNTEKHFFATCNVRRKLKYVGIAEFCEIIYAEACDKTVKGINNIYDKSGRADSKRML